MTKKTVSVFLVTFVTGAVFGWYLHYPQIPYYPKLPYYIKTTSNIFVGGWKGPDKDGYYRRDHTPAKLPAEITPAFDLSNKGIPFVLHIDDTGHTDLEQEGNYMVMVHRMDENYHFVMKPLTPIPTLERFRAD
ncbi:hypothetical protein ACLSU7_01070 [Bdellovibrio sp. HCB185ZH]|uniref:hypothetical protein n=1 Tax=Bdellovibrio sp. HCB185ZH TaxID=3394235 RepID=UPI0039A72E89